ncbi:hypothetical protein GBA52_028552 [Prunus armeniaca]|nr:hypothetical protein GBA52_028552 [Prunus armeniaca]
MALLLPIPGPSNSRWSEEATAISPGFGVWSRPGSTLWGVFLRLHPYENAKNRGRRRGQVCCWVPNAVYTHSHTQSSEQGGGGGSTQTQWKPKSGAGGKRREAVEAVGDAISIVNERIRREQSKRETRTVMESEEADKYIELVKHSSRGGLRSSEEMLVTRSTPTLFVLGTTSFTRRSALVDSLGLNSTFPIPPRSTSSLSMPMAWLSFLLSRPLACSIVIVCTPNETKRPRTLSKLSDTSVWEKRKIKGKIAIQKMVVDLMELYLHRLKQRRPPYPKTNAMTHFVSQFPYEPTPDQKQAFIDVHKDLTERETPMDRLICGDVGFGKTEVALRAIFCVVSAGKQAMVLAPTIVLAKQHFDVISDRFSVYSNIKVGLLSRFQTRAEKEEHLDMIKNGRLDIIVGTHSLLGSRVVYNNLGLLVVDEEQRFGVKQKERIASFKTSVDVLTLSATPIPRTLYLALTGFRDASLISTPPPERVPIKSHLSAYSKEKVLSAIKHELDRGGQVFYVLPRIKGLEEVMEFLEQSFPNVEIAIAHGRKIEDTSGSEKDIICVKFYSLGWDLLSWQYSKQLEETMEKFAQVVAWKGRRADKEAHAHLFYPEKSLLTDQALERLAALEECCELGQGFQLAERDMGIRGFGTIFGEQQTGDVGNVGIDLFFEMLFESLSKVDEHCVVSVPYWSVEIDINISPHLPSEYINYLENPMEIIQEAETAAEKDIWSLMQYAENLRH